MFYPAFTSNLVANYVNLTPKPVMSEYEFRSNNTGDVVFIEAESFDEACNLMFGYDGITEPYNHDDYELISVDGRQG